MPIDNAYIQNTIGSQQSFFLQSRSLTSDVSPGIPIANNIPQAASVGYAPPMPPAVYPSGMYYPPEMARPYFTSIPAAIQGYAFGIGADPNRFGPYEIQAAARTRLSRMGEDISTSALAGLRSFGGGMVNLAGWTLGGILGGLAGGPVGFVAGTALGTAVGEGAEALWNIATAPIEGVVQRRLLRRQLELEFATNPRLARLRPEMGQVGQVVESMIQDLVGTKERPGRYVRYGHTLDEDLSILRAGVAGGQFDFARNMDEFEQISKELIKNVRRTARILKVSLEDASKLMTELRQMGFFDLRNQMNMIETLGVTSNLAGIGVGAMTQIAAAGAQIGGGPWGAVQAAVTTGRLGLLYRSGGANAALIQRMGGAEAAGLAEMQSVQRFAGTPAGTLFLAMRAFGASDIGQLSSRINSPADIARMLSPVRRQEMIGGLGGDPGIAQLEFIQSTMRSMGFSEAEVNNPDMISLFSSGSLDSLQAEAILQRKRNLPQIQRQERIQYLASMASNTAGQIVPREGLIGAYHQIREWARGIHSRRWDQTGWLGRTTAGAIEYGGAFWRRYITGESLRATGDMYSEAFERESTEAARAAGDVAELRKQQTEQLRQIAGGGRTSILGMVVGGLVGGILGPPGAILGAFIGSRFDATARTRQTSLENLLARPEFRRALERYGKGDASAAEDIRRILSRDKSLTPKDVEVIMKNLTPEAAKRLMVTGGAADIKAGMEMMGFEIGQIQDVEGFEGLGEQLRKLESRGGLAEFTSLVEKAKALGLAGRLGETRTTLGAAVSMAASGAMGITEAYKELMRQYATQGKTPADTKDIKDANINAQMVVIMADPSNIKITSPGDALLGKSPVNTLSYIPSGGYNVAFGNKP